MGSRACHTSPPLWHLLALLRRRQGECTIYNSLLARVARSKVTVGRATRTYASDSPLHRLTVRECLQPKKPIQFQTVRIRPFDEPGSCRIFKDTDHFTVSQSIWLDVLSISRVKIHWHHFLLNQYHMSTVLIPKCWWHILCDIFHIIIHIKLFLIFTFQLSRCWYKFHTTLMWTPIRI
jgi:hypothetical protein